MKKKKILISLAGLVAVVAISTTITAYTLAGDGSSTPAQESLGTQEPAFDVGGPATFEPGPGQMSDDGSVFVDNPDGEDGATGGPAPGSQGTGIDKLPEPVDGKVPAIEPVIDPIEPAEGSGEVVTVTPPKEDVEDADDQAVRVGPGTGELIDPLLATGAEVKVTGEVISDGIFSVDGRVIEVNGESVQVMDYGDAAALEAEAEAAGISPRRKLCRAQWTGKHDPLGCAPPLLQDRNRHRVVRG